MKTVYDIFCLRLQDFFSNWQTIFAVLLLPLFFIYLMGSTFSSENSQTRNVNVFVDEDQSSYSRQLLELVESNQLVEVLRRDREEAFQLLRQMRAQNVFIIPQGFGADIAAGDIPTVDKYASNGLHTGTTQFQILAGIFRMVAINRTGKLVAEDLARNAKIQPSQVSATEKLIITQAEEYWNRDIPFALDVQIFLHTEAGNNNPTQLSFLGMATGMMVSFMAFFLGFGVVFIIHDSESGLLKRISLIAGEKRYYYGNLMAMLLLAVGTTLLISLLTQLGFGIAIPCNYLAYGTILFCYGLLLVSGLSYLSLMVGNAPAMYSVAAPLIIFFSLLGGCFFSIEALPEILRYVTYLSPQGLAMQGIRDAAQGEFLAMFFSCFAMLMAAFPFIFLTLRRLRRHLI